MEGGPRRDSAMSARKFNAKWRELREAVGYAPAIPRAAFRATFGAAKRQYGRPNAAWKRHAKVALRVAVEPAERSPSRAMVRVPVLMFGPPRL